jgi:hypothetical protein
VNVRRPAFGLAAALVYLGLAAVAFGPGELPVRPLFDGLAPPQPYRWVDPPEALAAQNQPPLAGTGEVPLGPDGSDPGQALTGDGQARLVLPEGVFPPRDGASAVSITITPLAPDTAAPPPEGLAFQGNAYRFEAEYVPAGGSAEPVRTANVLLHYPSRATVLLRLDGSAWRRLPSQDVPSNLLIFANSDRLGTFVAAGPPADGGGGSLLVVLASGGAALLALVLGLYLRLRAGRKGNRRRGRRTSRR